MWMVLRILVTTESNGMEEQVISSKGESEKREVAEEIFKNNKIIKLQGQEAEKGGMCKRTHRARSARTEVLKTGKTTNDASKKQKRLTVFGCYCHASNSQSHCMYHMRNQILSCCCSFFFFGSQQALLAYGGGGEIATY